MFPERYTASFRRAINDRPYRGEGMSHRNRPSAAINRRIPVGVDALGDPDNERNAAAIRRDAREVVPYGEIGNRIEIRATKNGRIWNAPLRSIKF